MISKELKMTLLGHQQDRVTYSTKRWCPSDSRRCGSAKEDTDTLREPTWVLLSIDCWTSSGFSTEVASGDG